MNTQRSNRHVTDMTTGNPTKLLLSFTIPLVIGNIFQQFYNMVDSYVVGNYVSANALAAVGACGSLNFLVFALSAGMSGGIGVIVAQHFGSKDEKRLRSTIANAFYILLALSIVTTILGYAFSPWLLRLLGTPDVILADSITYMRTTCIGIVFITIYSGVSSILRALGDSKTSLYFLIISGVINAVLDVVFVLAFHWDVFGVALATVLAQFVSALTCVVYAFAKVSYFRLKKGQLKPDRNIIKNSISLGAPLILQESMIAVSCMVLQGVTNSYGEVVIAASTIVGRIDKVLFQLYASLGVAITTYTGQNMGAGKIERVKQGFKSSVIIVLIYSLLLLPLVYFGSPYLIGAFVKEQEVIDIGVKAFQILSLSFFFLGMIYVPRAVLIGAGDTGFAMLNGVTEVLCRIIYSQILTRIPLFGFWGIWLTTCATWLTTAIVCCVRYARGSWIYKTITREHKTA